MDWRRRFCLLFAVVCMAFGAVAYAAPDQTARPADWVDVAPLPVSQNRVADGESEFLLVDHQVRVHRQSEHYQRYVQRLRNAQQVEQASQITIDFRPGLEEITVHEVVVWRDGARIDQWPGARRTVLHREQELERGIIDDTRTLSLILSDVRSGDTLDYSYTVVRNHHLTGGRFSGTFRTRWEANIERQRIRVLHPRDRAIRHTLLNEALAPEVRPWGERDTEKLWEWRGLEPHVVPDHEPTWFSSAPFVYLTEFSDWSEVAAWAMPFYRTPTALPATIEALLAQFADADSEAAKILAALRFVQDEIRYTGIAIAEGAIVPSPPDVVLARRYGDCKDKVLLLITLLRAQGIEADAALVNVRWPLGRDERPPSPAQFDHVVARVVSEGKVYWLDPVIASQGGQLSDIAPLRYGAALVLRPDSRELEPIAVGVPDVALIDTHEWYDLRLGRDQPAKLIARTRYRGGEADMMRRRLERQSSAELTKSYLDYYLNRFPKAQSREAVTWKDDRVGNVLEVVESYELPGHFTVDGTREFFELVPYGVKDNLPAAPEASRTQPMALRFPLHVRHEVEVLFPDDWPLEGSATRIEGPGFEFSTESSYQGRRLHTVHRFRTTADHVAAADLAVFRTKIGAVQEQMGLTLWQPTGALLPTRDDVSFVYLAVAFVSLALGIVLSRHLWLRKPAITQPAPEGSPSGLAGWMILVVFGVVVTPVGTVFAIRETLPFLHESLFAGMGSGLTGRADAVWLQIPLLAWIALAWVRLPVGLTTMGLMFARRRGFTTAWLWTNWGTVAFLLISALLVLPSFGIGDTTVLQSVTDFVLGFIHAAFWSGYMLSSNRVRATFVRDRPVRGEESRTTVVTA